MLRHAVRSWVPQKSCASKLSRQFVFVAAIVSASLLGSARVVAYDVDATQFKTITDWVLEKGKPNALDAERAAQLGLSKRSYDGRAIILNADGDVKIVFNALRSPPWTVAAYSTRDYSFIWLINDQGHLRATVEAKGWTETTAALLISDSGHISADPHEDFLSGTFEAISDWMITDLNAPGSQFAGECRLASDNTAATIAACSRAIESQRVGGKALSDAYFHRALALSEQKKYSQAIRDFDQAVRLGPKEAHYVWFRACTREAMRDKKGAKADFDRGRKLGYQMPAEGWDARCGL